MTEGGYIQDARLAPNGRIQIVKCAQCVAESRDDLIRLSKDALETGDKKAALAYARQALAKLTADAETWAFSAWLFSETGHIADAVSCFARLEIAAPLSAAQHMLWGEYAVTIGDQKTALERFTAAVVDDPSNAAYLASLANALVDNGRLADAASVIKAAFRESPGSAELADMAGSVAMRAGRHGLAFLFAKKASRLARHSSIYLSKIATLLGNQGRFNEALSVLSTIDSDWADSNPSFFFQLSTFQAQCGNYEDALISIRSATCRDPDNIVYSLHEAAILSMLYRYDDSSEIYLKVLSGENIPDESVLRSAFAVFTEAGRYIDATRTGAILLSNHPEDRGIAAAFEHVLSRRSIAGLYAHQQAGSVESQSTDPPRKRRLREDIGPIHLQLRLISALFMRETRTRFGRAKLGYAWALFEPLAHIGIMIFLISAIGHTGLPPIGDSYALFYFTGIIPYHLFTHTAGHLIHSVPENRPLLQIPRVKTLDVYIARALLEGVTELAVASIFITVFVMIGLNSLPINLLGVLAALALLWFAAWGVGMVNAVITSFFSGWERVWGALTSILYFSSGTFYVPRVMPEWLRDYLVWNPVLHAIEMVRVNYFNEPYPHWLDISYLASWSAGAMILGFSLERIYRAHLLEIE